MTFRTDFLSHSGCLAANYLDEALIESAKAETSCQKAFKGIRIVSSLTLGELGTYPYIPASLAVPNAVVSAFSLFGSLICFGAFASNNINKCILYVTKPRTTCERQLLNNDQWRMTRISNISLSILFAACSQSPVIEVSLAFGQNPAIATVGAIIALIAATAPPTISLLELLVNIEDFMKKMLNRSLKGAEGRLLQDVKTAMLSNLKMNELRSIRLDANQRKEAFGRLYVSLILPEEQEKWQRMRELSKQLFTLTGDKEVKPLRRSCCAAFNSKVLYGVATILTLPYLFEIGMLANGTARDFTDNQAIIVPFIMISVVPWLWFCATIPGNSWVKIYSLIKEALGGENEQRTFFEEMHPKLCKFSAAISLCLSLLPYGQIMEIASQYYDPSTIWGKVCIGGSLLTIMSFFFESMQALVETLVEVSDRSKGAEQAKILELRDKLKDISEVIKHLSLPDLKKLLQCVGDSELVQDILQDCAWEEEKIVELLGLKQSECAHLMGSGQLIN